MQQSELMKRLFSLYRQTAKETARHTKFHLWGKEEFARIWAITDEEGRLIASIVGPVFKALTQEAGKPGDFLPALVLNGPQSGLAPLVREHLIEFCEHLVATEVAIRAIVTERKNADGEPCVGLERIAYVPEPLFQW